MAQELVAIVNPRRKTKKRRKTTTKRKSRRNPTLATVSNPRRRSKRRSTRLSSKKWTYRKRRSRRNPSAGFKIGPESIGFTAAGAIASKLLPSFIPKVKDYNSGIIGLGIQGGVGLAIYFLLGMLKMKKAANYVLLGTGVNLTITALDTFVIKRGLNIQGLGLYPEDTLAALGIDSAEYEVVGVEGLSGYEEIPLNESLGSLGAGAVTAARRSPAIARRPIRAARPAVSFAAPAMASCGGRLTGRW